jgi:hypothetical protein
LKVTAAKRFQRSWASADRRPSRTANIASERATWSLLSIRLFRSVGHRAWVRWNGGEQIRGKPERLAVSYPILRARACRRVG